MKNMENLKNYLLNQDILGIKKNFKLKIFDYFYKMLDRKNAINFYILYLLHFLEIIQLISFAFSTPFTTVWKLSEKINSNLISILSGFRITPLFSYISIKNSMILLLIIFFLIIIFFVFLMIQISLKKENSQFFDKSMIITKWTSPFLIILLFIPITELFLSPLNCRNNHINLRTDEVQCWKATHLILVLISLIGIIVYSLLIFLLTFFYFYPFTCNKSNTKMNSSVDIVILMIKFIYVIQKIFIKEEYISITILLLLSIYLINYQNKQPIYNDKKLELFLNLRNILLCWTYFVLLIAKISYNSHIITMIYLLLAGYPLVVFTYIMYFNERNNRMNFNHTTINDVNICLAQLKFLMKLIDSFFYEKKSNLNKDNNDNEYNKTNDLLLKGFIRLHTINCLKENCPLTKFIKSKGNYNIQKQCLLNYMNIFFNNSIKEFPNNILIRMYYIQFNYDKKYNLNNIKATLETIKKMKFNISNEFILYCQEKEISKIKIRDVNDGNDEEKDKLILDQNYKKLKNLIANSSKLFAEFWGIFAANITNNLNTQKLYKLGEKLNAYLKEIDNLWERNLKNKKIDVVNENNAQLYCRFLNEILWDQNKADAVQKKINDEHNILSYNRDVNEEKNQLDNIDNLETQDFLIFINSDEKGKTNIIQYSNSLSELICYQKSELINKPIETLMPSLLSKNHSQNLEKYIKVFITQKNLDKDSFQIGDKMKQFTLMKNNMGYLLPFNVQYTLYDNNDFSNNFLIKAKLEIRDVKSLYAYYLLTKPDFSLESISSSAIHIGLSMDLLKKYVIKLNILIRTSNEENINLYDKYKDFKNEPVKITWVEPELIYPKNDLSKLKDQPIQDLIKESKKRKMFLQIFEIKYGDEIVAFVFKLFEKKNSKNKKEYEFKRFIPDNKNQFIFDLLNLHYIRAKIVKEKTGFRNLRENDNDKDNKNSITIAKTGKKGIINDNDSNNIDEISEVEKEEIVITRDKIFDLQSKDSKGIKSFINSLKFFGSDISLIKHRPNREQYPAGKIQEPKIKIDASKYIKLIESKLEENPKLLKKIKIMQKEKKLNNETENFEEKQNYINEEIKLEENKKIGIQNISKDFSGNNNISLIKVININSIKSIKVIDFFIYFFVIMILVVHFILTYIFFQNNYKRYSYFTYSYQLLNSIIYCKYFVSEGIYLSEVSKYPVSDEYSKSNYLRFIKERLAYYGDDITDIIHQFNNPSLDLPDEYIEFVANTNLTIKTNNEFSKNEQQPLSSALNKLTTAIFYLSSLDNNNFYMKNNYAYELMVNLMDSYYKVFEKIILIMINFLDERTKDIRLNTIIIFFISFFITVAFLILYYRMLVKLEKDREKSLNLFLTIKNGIFENLKNSSENFSNKLLNKLFRVDENEEESQQNYSKINIKPNDINIAKFKALNEYKSLNKNENSFMKYFVQLLLIYAILNIIILWDYINTILFCSDIHDFIHIYNSTYFSEIYLITRVNIIKQYFFNSSITNYGFKESEVKYNFLYVFLFMSEEIESTIKETSKTDTFLVEEYKALFTKYFNENITDLVNEELSSIDDKVLQLYLVDYLEKGFSSVNSRIFESLKYLTIRYYIDPEIYSEKNISNLINDERWVEIHNLLFRIVRPWYKNIKGIISSNYITFLNQRLNFYIYIFIILLILISIFYWIIWKHNEEEFIDSIQKSIDLINLIPEEIKNIIINKLNEN